MSEEKQSFYEKYLIPIWYVVGLTAVIAYGTMSERAIENFGLLLPLLFTLVVAVFAGYLLFILTMMILYRLSFIFDGFKDTDLDIIFAVIYVLIALFYYYR